MMYNLKHQLGIKWKVLKLVIHVTYKKNKQQNVNLHQNSYKYRLTLIFIKRMLMLWC